ncbi:hypothetical protein HXX76_012530 [Chlamydomonas incerta]|uniref:Protein kinase domain-containing protein n=1 Tax=Chlamydomonas incerta TaxID=51695 RepID=A0A835SV42_CHLIN|nr:hypothetical protein HXX76_012530 [Chlamydomonas incerta]|eukprot:KAG2427335.1 hypothetical protein HXX76_012530 [Chlamydomonas incerta]
MESCALGDDLTNTGPVRVLSSSSELPWRVAKPEDQPVLTNIGAGALTSLTFLGGGAYGSVELCRVSVPLLQGAAGLDQDATEQAAPPEDAPVSGRSSCPDTPPATQRAPASNAPDLYRRLRVWERASSPGGVSPAGSGRLPELQPPQSAQSPVGPIVGAGSGVAGGPPLRTSGAGTPSGASPRHPAASMSPGAELVVAVKRVDYTGSSRQPDGGGSRPRGPSKVRLSRMQAIEMLQLSRCRDCPFIVRLFGCVPDDPRASMPAPAEAPVSADCTSAGPGRRQRRLSCEPAPTSSSSATSCRIVMEWAEGGDLGSFLQGLAARRGPCSDAARERLLMGEASAKYYLACLLEALGYLHGRNLLHRDVKPSNLLLASDGRAKLGDLGMTCHLDKTGLAAGRAGTPNFMAPEVWAFGTTSKFNKGYGVTADLWSAGVVLHELLTGHLPESHPDEYLRPNWRFKPHHCGALFSPELRDLLGRLLAFKPRRRPQSCEEVRAHPWFAGFDWQGLRDGTLPAPYVPEAHRPQSAAALALSGRLRQSWPSRAPSGGSGSAAMMGGMPPVLEECGPPAASGGGAAAEPGRSTTSGGTNAGGTGPGYNSAAVFQPVLNSSTRHARSLQQQAAGSSRNSASSLRGHSPSRASSGPALCDAEVEPAPCPPAPQRSWAPSWLRNVTLRAGAVVASFPSGSAAPGPDGPLQCGGSSYDPGASPTASQRPSLSDRSVGSMTCSPSTARDARPAEMQPGAMANRLKPSRSRLSLLGGEAAYGAAASVPLSVGALPPRYRPGPASLPPPSGHTSESACITGRTPSAVSSSAVGGSSSVDFNGKGLWHSAGVPVSQGPSQQHRATSMSVSGEARGDWALSVPAALHNAVAGFLLACSPMAPAAQRYPDSAAASVATGGQSTLRDSMGPWGGDAEAEAPRQGSVTCRTSASATSWSGAARGVRDSKGRWLERPMAAMDALLAVPAQLQDAAIVAAAAMGFAGRRPRISPAPIRDAQHSLPASLRGLGCSGSNLASSRASSQDATLVGPPCGDCRSTADAVVAAGGPGAGAAATPVADVLNYLTTDETGSGVCVITRTSPCLSSSSAAASPAKQHAAVAKQPAAVPTNCSNDSAFAVAAIEVALAAAAHEASDAITPGSRPLHRPTNSFAFDPAITATGSPQRPQMSPTEANHSPLGAAASSSGHSRMKSFSFDVNALSLGGSSGSPGVIAGGQLMHSAEGGGAGAHALRPHVPLMGAIEEGEPSPASSSSPLMGSPASVQAEGAGQEGGGGGGGVAPAGLRRRSSRGPLHRRPPWAAGDDAAAPAGCCGQGQRLQAADLAPVCALLVALMLAACMVRLVAAS